jgi:hypothetical protein
MSTKLTRNCVRYNVPDVVELVTAFPNRRFKNLDIKETLGDQKAKYYARKMTKFHAAGVVVAIEKCNIVGHKQSHLWEIPQTVADYALAISKGEIPERIRSY